MIPLVEREERLSPAQKRTAARAGGGRIRIVGGRWRGRRLTVPVRADLRPTPDRVRETLFNWLQPYIEGADCLDLFAGTGALGFEAASRGARSVCLVERDRQQAGLLQEQSALLGADNVEVLCTDGIAWLQQTTARFDIVFLDPPFDSGLLQSGLTILAERAILHTSGLVYVEQTKGRPAPAGWQVFRETRAGRVQARLLKPADGAGEHP